MHSCPNFLLQTLSSVEFFMKKVGQECVSQRNRVILVLGLLTKAQAGEALQVNPLEIQCKRYTYICSSIPVAYSACT